MPVEREARPYERTVAGLVEQRALTLRDLDAIMVAFGYISYAAIDSYLSRVQSPPAGSPAGAPQQVQDADSARVASEIVDRICSCQYHDHGVTHLEYADASAVHLRVGGACRHCPQIVYTAGVLERALRYRLPHLQTVKVDGIDLETETTLPVNSQYTLAKFCQVTGLELADLDRALSVRPALVDDDLLMLGRMAAHRKAAGRMCSS